MVGSFTRLLQKRYHGQLDETANRYIDYAVDGAQRMQNLINDLLGYSRAGRQPLNRETVNMAAAVAAAIENLSLRITEKNAGVEVGDLPPITGDDTLLTQVFQNLIGNALKFCQGREPRIKIAAELRGAEWIFSVADNGIGIPAAHQERIFVLFQRLHSQSDYPGTGIGLAFCKMIVERHGGRIWLESIEGEGTTFFIALPADTNLLANPGPGV